MSQRTIVARPGAKPTDRYPGSGYVIGKGREWEALQTNEVRTRSYESAVNAACDQLQRAQDALRIANCLLHGGHVSNGAMHRAGMKPDMSPAQALNQAMSLVPNDVVDKALRR